MQSFNWPEAQTGFSDQKWALDPIDPSVRFVCGIVGPLDNNSQ